jgi:transposase
LAFDLRCNTHSEGLQVIRLGHLGIVAAMIKELGIIEKIDKRLPVSKEHGAILTIGQRVSAMILNGLGFLNDRLYMHPKFFEDKPVGRLFGEEIRAEHFNDDTLGRALDKIYEYGTTKLYSEIGFEIAQERNLLGKTAGIDTTSLSLEGAYESEVIEIESDKKPPLITYGHSKDHRQDLKQVMLSLTCTGPAGFPLWMEALDGNSSDKKNFHESLDKMTKFQKELQNAPDFIFVADSALYTIDKLLAAPNLRWLTRVPERLNEVKALCEQPKEAFQWIELGSGYQMVPITSEYGGIKQRWQLIYSEQAYAREKKTLLKRIDKEGAALKNELWHLGNQIFGCDKDAERAIRPIIKKLKYHQIQYCFDIVEKNSTRGRPGKNTSLLKVGYKINSSFEKDTTAITIAENRLGKFVLGTNELDSARLPDFEMLSEYKNLSQNEAGFKFIKNTQFCIDSVFLKTPARIEALMMIMTLCLMVYNVGQHKLRTILEEKKETVPNQVKKQIQNPTLQWIFRILDTVSVVRIVIDKANNIVQELIGNLTELTRRIIGYFGEAAMRIYGVI